jgi:hypothetical protein
MDKENVASMHTEVLFSHKEKRNYIVCRKIGGTGDHYVKKRKVQKDKYSMFSFVCRI